MKKLILILPLLAFSVLHAQQMRSCCSPDATESFARNASDPKFTMSHDEPLPFTYVSERGKDVNFIDFGYYLVGDRQVMRAESSPHFKFSSDVTVYRIIEHVDGKPWLQSAIAPQNSTSTLSPFVSLGER